jgi:hypothetical protein
VHGEPFPHLLVRRIGTRNEVLSPSVARRLLVHVAASAGLRDAGEPIHFTPHDFRRLFTTEMVSTGLPLHIATTLLGHLNLDTTRGYTAVFPEEVIAAHQHFIERAPPGQAASCGRRPVRSGPSSRTTSCCARSPSATATALTARHASMNTPA